MWENTRDGERRLKSTAVPTIFNNSSGETEVRCISSLNKNELVQPASTRSSMNVGVKQGRTTNIDSSTDTLSKEQRLPLDTDHCLSLSRSKCENAILRHDQVKDEEKSTDKNEFLYTCNSTNNGVPAEQGDTQNNDFPLEQEDTQNNEFDVRIDLAHGAVKNEGRCAKMIQHSTGKLVFCAAGIFVCYSYYAILQEKVTRGQYVDQGTTEKFTYMFALVFVQCVINCLFAKLLLMTVMKQGEDTTRTVYYVTCALTYLLAMVCSNMALQFVNYPTQVVGKAGKPIPVMILGVLIGGKTYPFRKYCFVTLIVTGVVIFMYKDNVPTKQIEGESFGQILLLLSLLMDGLTSAVQDKMRAEHKTKSGHMMFSMNVWSVLFSGVVILLSGELVGFIQFLQRHPAALQHIMTLSICGALGQYFIFLTVSEFGPLTCSIATTTRKCFTVLASVVFFGNSLLPRQWVASFIVFLGLFLDSFYGKIKAVKKDIAK